MTKSIFFQRLSATVQFILGFVLGISLIAGISGAMVFAYYKKMSVSPKKPEFPEVAVPQDEVTADIDTETEDKETEAIEPLESTTEEPVEEPVPEEVDETTPPEEEEPPSEAELPPNAYRAEVTWPEGLSLRAEPSVDAERVGGIESKATIFILEDSADGNWQRVQLPWNGQEGWVKGGNTRQL